MNIWLKRILLTIVGLIILLVVGVAIFIATFDPNSYKSKLESYVFDNYGRTLAINGDINLSVFPDFALELNEVAITEPNSKDNFASLNQARLSVAVMPLLSKNLKVDAVSIAGLNAKIIHNVDGSFNFDDLAGANKDASTAEEGSDTTVTPSSKKSKSADLSIDIAGIEIKDGKIDYLDKKSNLNLNVDAINVKTGVISFNKSFDVAVSAKVKSVAPKLDLALAIDTNVSLGNNFNDINAKNLKIKIDGDAADFKKLNSLLKADLKLLNQDIEISGMQLQVAGELAGEKPIKGINLGLDGGKISLNSNNGASQGNINLTKITYKDEIRNLEISNLGAAIKSTDKQLAVNDIVADIYEGKLNGQFISTNKQQLALKLDLQKIALQPLLQAVSGKDLIKGYGSTQIDVNSQGKDLLAIEKNLNGKFAMQVSDGAILGVDVRKTLEQTGEMISDIKNIRLDKISSPFAPGYSTVFSNFDALLSIKSGIATVTKLLLNTDIITLTQGKPAQINIPKQSLDLVLEAKISDKVGQNKKLENLAGAVIPVYVSGNWADPHYAVKIEDLIKSQGIENIIKSGINKLLGNDEKGSSTKSESKEESIGKTLKGLFGG